MKATEYCSLLDKQISQFTYFREDFLKRQCMLFALLSDLRIGLFETGNRNEGYIQTNESAKHHLHKLNF